MAPSALKGEALISRESATQAFGSFRVLQGKGSYPKNFVIRNVAWNNAGTKLACIENDKYITVWHTDKPDSRSFVDFRTMHEHSLEDMSWDPLNSEHLATVAADGQLFIYNTKSKSPFRSRRILLQDVNGGSTDVSADNGSKMDVDSASAPASAPPAMLRYVTYSPNGKWIALVSRSDHVILIDAQSDDLTIITTYKESDEICDILWSNNSEQIIVALGSGAIDILSVVCDEEIQEFSIDKVHSLLGNRSRCLQLDPRGKRLVVGTREGVVNIWDTSDWTCVATITDVDESVADMSITGDGIYLAVSYESGSSVISIYDLFSTLPVHSIPVQNPTVAPSIMWNPLKYSLAYSGDSYGVSVFARASS